MKFVIFRDVKDGYRWRLSVICTGPNEGRGSPSGALYGPNLATWK